MSNKIIFFSVSVLLAMGFVLGNRSGFIVGSVGPLLGFKVTNQTLDLSSVQETYKTLLTHYDGSLNTQKLIDGANHGLVAAAGDKYTVYLDSEESGDLDKDIHGDIGGGIGAEIGVRQGQPTVVRILPDNPAANSGLQAGDVIVAVNDELSNGWNTEKTATKIRGKAGTTVKLDVRRGTKQLEFTITRAEVNNPSIQSEVKNGVGVLTITRFDDNTGPLARQAAEKLKAQGVKGIIVDLRGNGGGYIDAAVDVASLWLDNQVVVSQKHNGKTTSESQASGDPILKGMKTIVLLNEGSASASEIVAGALKDKARAILVGEKSFGKGTVQEILSLSGGSELKVTVARWYTPNGYTINERGFTPDTIVKLTQSDINAGRDPQLEKALQLFQ